MFSLNGWVNSRVNNACINEPFVLYTLELSLGFPHASAFAFASASAHVP